MGATFGEAGVVYTDQIAAVVNVDHVPGQFNEEDTESLAYFAGWMTLSLAPGADVLADSRDCVVVSGDLVFDSLDCAGAGISAISTLGQAGGLATLPSGGGVLVAGGASVDLAEDAATDVTVISARAIKNGQSAKRVAKFVVLRTKISADKFVSEVVPRLDNAKNKQAIKSVAAVAEQYRRLDSVDSLSSNQAYALAKVVHNGDTISADEVAEIAGRIDHFDDLPYSSQGYLVEQLAKRDDAVQAAGRLSDLNPDTLRLITSQEHVGKVTRLLDEVGGGANVLNSLRRTDDGRRALNQFLSMENGLANADGVNQIERTPAELANRIRISTLRAATDDHESIRMSAETIASFSNAVTDLSRGDVDNLANQLNNDIAKQTLTGPDRTRRNIFNNIKGGYYEIILANERFGSNRVEAIGDIRKLDGADREADIVLKDGTAIEAKANTVSDLNGQLSNIRDYQKLSSSEDAKAILIANNPSEVTTGPVDGIDNSYVRVSNIIKEFII